MATFAAPGIPVTTEPVFITETFANGIEPPTNFGDYFRVIVFADRPPDERIVVARLVFPRADFLRVLRVAMDTNVRLPWLLS